MKIIHYSELDASIFEYQELEEISTVKRILAGIARDGDAAVKKYTRQFDKATLSGFRVPQEQIASAFEQVDEGTRSVLLLAASNIRRFAERQLEDAKDFEYEIQPGVFTGQKVIPIERVGVYVPGGRFPLISTLLMCAIPGRVAGVKELIVCSPPSHQGAIHPLILAAAKIADIDEVYQIGGVQAIGAMAYGTESIRRVDKIVGPGNKYVAAAKKEAYGLVGIDFIAGPTEVLILADESGDPEFIAADLLAQAEHDPEAKPILVTTSEKLADAVAEEVAIQLDRLATREIAGESVEKNGLIVLVDRFENAIQIANQMAPEHLELQCADPDAWIPKLKKYGSLFIGAYAAEVLGDYSSGLNHTLPTNAAARYAGGLSVRDFLKFQTTLRVTERGLKSIGPVAKFLAEMENLAGHAAAADVRLKRF